LGTLHNLMEMCTDNTEMILQLEAIVLPLVDHIFQNNILDFVEEAAELFEVFSSLPQVSARGWLTFQHIYESFTNGNLHNMFPEICASLYNMVRYGLAGEGSPIPAGAPEAIFTIAKAVWEADDGEDEMWHAGRILENFMLWCQGQVDEFVPVIIGFAITKLLQGGGAILGKPLRLMCMNMVISALYYNPELTIRTIESVPLAAGEEPLISRFLALWFSQIEDFTGLHNRKLGIFTLCKLVKQPYAAFPPHLQQIWPHVVSVLLGYFSKLAVAYEMKAEAEGEPDYEDDLEDEYGEDAYDSDGGLPDELDAGGAGDADELLEKLYEAGLQEDEDDDDEAEELDLNQYGQMDTPLDVVDQEEYGLFASLLAELPATDQQSAEALFAGVKPEHQAQIEEVQKMAHNKAKEQEARALRQQGGYNFANATVPQTFEFTSP